MTISKQLLKLAGVLTFSVALFQAVITSVPSWARYFGAWEQVASKLWLLYLTGFFVALVFALFGFYALSGAGIIKRLPLLRSGLVIIGVLFTLRGLFLVLELLINAGILQGSMIIPTRELVSSSVSLIIGLFYLIGTIGNWSNLPLKIKNAL
ncbi:MAG: hypothetical protein A2080_06805 [Ignavibacteria bacterium GWC2_36_12]|nr:MAG: hypothetical protein A2080_06805 [Ignavibacteria bacterium GWC2_36_12]